MVDEHIIMTNGIVSEALKMMDDVKPKILFVCDDEMKLKATITDGDLRRHFLSGGVLSESVLEVANCRPVIAHDYAEAEKKYNRDSYIAIPIVNSCDELVDYYFDGKLGDRKKIPLRAPIVINAGGRGVRLEPFTKVLPKPLIPVGDLPIIEHIMNCFSDYECTKYHIIVNYKKNLIKAYFSEGDKQYDINWYDEEKPLGTGGGLSLLKGHLDQTFFFSSCDTLLLADYSSALQFHRDNGNAVTIICALKTEKIPYGVIDLNTDGSLREIREKPELSFFTNTGVYIVEPFVLNYIDDNVPMGFPDIIEAVKTRNEKVGVFPIRESEWLDMGQMSELEKMRMALYGE